VFSISVCKFPLSEKPRRMTTQYLKCASVFEIFAPNPTKSPENKLYNLSIRCYRINKAHAEELH
jgi:hypothetical protein